MHRRTARRLAAFTSVVSVAAIAAVVAGVSGNGADRPASSKKSPAGAHETLTSKALPGATKLANGMYRKQISPGKYVYSHGVDVATGTRAARDKATAERLDDLLDPRSAPVERRAKSGTRSAPEVSPGRFVVTQRLTGGKAGRSQAFELAPTDRQSRAVVESDWRKWKLRRPVCAADSDRSIEFIVLTYADQPDRWSVDGSKFWSGVLNSNYILNEESRRANGPNMDLKMRCNAAGDPLIWGVRTRLRASQGGWFETQKELHDVWGFRDPKRRYVIFQSVANSDIPITQAAGHAGIGWGSPSQNVFDGKWSTVVNYPSYAVIYTNAWTGTVLHELVHTWGGVAYGAPNRDGAHCKDGADIMCYGGTRCGGGDMRLDCGSDDYFHPRPETLPSGHRLKGTVNVGAPSNPWIHRTEPFRAIGTNATGTTGRVLDGYGSLYDLNGNQLSTGGWKGWDIARSIAVRSNGSSGWILDGWGGIHTFGGAPKPASPGPYWAGWDIARDVAYYDENKGSGYVLDGWGGIHAFGGAPKASGGPYWKNWDIANAFVLLPNKKGGYVLDGWGGVHPFAIGSNPKPPAVSGAYWRGWDIARDIQAHPGGQGVYVLDGWGGVHRYGGAPALSAVPGYTRGVDGARGFAIWRSSATSTARGTILRGNGNVNKG